MKRIDDTQRQAYSRYIQRHRVMEFIDCAIFSNMGDIYQYVDNEAGLHTNSTCRLSNHDFKTDLVYLSNDRKAVLFVEETLDPTNKKEQLIKYAETSNQCLQLITKADFSPHLDVMVVVPEKQREAALRVYEEVVKETGKLGRERGISLWFYNEKRTQLKCFGGTLSPYFPKTQSELPSKGIGTFKILKTAPPVFVLQFFVMKALEQEYGESENGIEFDKVKLLKWLGDYGIVKEERWREALNIGNQVGWIDSYSPEQLTGVINYTKVSPRSISRSKELMSDFFTAIEVEVDTRQKSLWDFAENKNEDPRKINEDEEEAFDGEVEQNGKSGQ